MFNSSDDDVPVVEVEAEPYAALSPRTRRKRKNRDQMRAARQRERETMDRLRSTVERLEVQYRTMQQSDKPTKQEVIATIGSSRADNYARVVELKAQAQEENFLLKQALYDKYKQVETLERIADDLTEPTEEERKIMMHDFPPINEDDLALSAQSDAPLSQDAVWAIISNTHRHMSIVHQRLRGPQHGKSQSTSGRITIIASSPPASPSFSPESPQSSPQQQATGSTGLPPFCGWDVSHSIEPDALWFAFDKAFPHVPALTAMQRMWDNEHKMMTYRDAHAAQLQTMQIVQEINDDTYIFERRISDPATNRLLVIKTLRYRMRTATGYLIGQSTLNQPGDADKDKYTQDQVWASNASHRTEFEPQGNGCVVKITGSINRDGRRNVHRQVADVIINLLRWEHLNIGPMFTLEY